MRHQTRSLCAAAGALLAFGATAKTSTWTGANSAVWDLTTANWSSGGAATTFAVGDDAILSDGAGVSNTDITFGAAVKPKTVAVNVAGSFVWRYGNTPFAGTETIIKDGGGTLGIYKASSDSGFSGLMDIRAGRVEVSMPNQLSGFGNNCTVVVRQGAELRTLDRISIGSPQYGSKVNLRLSGKLALYNGSGADSHGANSVKTLSLEGGSIEVNCAGSSGDPGFGGVFCVHDAVYATNGTAQTLELVNNGSYGNCDFIFSNDKPLEFRVDDLTGDAQPDLTFKGPVNRFNAKLRAGTAGFTKTGAGTLLWNTFPDANHYPNGDIAVREGTLRFAANQNFLQSRTNQTFYVGTNATLQFTLRNAMLPQGCFNDGEHCKTSFHIDHGTIVFGDPDLTENNGLWGHNFAGRELILDNATFVNHLSGAGTTTNSYGLMTFGVLVSLKGETPYTIGTTHSSSVERFNLFHETPTEFRVDDISKNDGIDATFEGGFCDYYDIRTESCCRSGFVKTGSGTMRLTGHNGTFTGDAEIRAGTVTLDRDNYTYAHFGAGDKSYLGNMNLPRTITVWTNAVLDLRQRNMFKMMNGRPVEDAFQATIALRGGKLRQADTYCNCLPNLFVENGEVAYENGMGGSWGVMAVAGTLTVAGDVLFALDAKEGCSSQHFILGRTNVVFDVADVTGSPADDFRMGLQLRRPPEAVSADYDWGFTKRGMGTMRLAGDTATCRPNGRAAVEAGTLLVDASATLAELARLSVEAGAAIGGTGTVRNVTFAAGAGFAGTCGQDVPLTISGDVALPTAGFVDISVPDGTPVVQVRATVAEMTGRVSGDVSGWTVRINGQVPEQNVYHVGLSGKKVVAGFLRGTTLIFR